MTWRRSNKLFSVLALLVLVLTTLPAALAQKPETADKVEKAVLETLASKGSADVVVVFAEQTDLSPAYQMGWKERGWFVYNTLTEVADRSQAKTREYLEGRGLAYRSYIAGNEMYIWAGDLQAVNSLAALPEVASIYAPRTITLDPVVVDETAPAPQATTDWGITDTKADQFWAAYGFKGEGIVVANIDTGVQWDHPALINQYKCNGLPQADCWYDPDGTYTVPTDNNGHGTHTMGTMVSKDDQALTYIAGMAPNAQWIACQGCDTSSCDTADLLACADWIVAPNGNPDNRPNIVNNSWGSSAPCDTWYLSKVQAWRAVGIFPAFSAGNTTSCNALGTPGVYQESFGTTGHNSTRGHYGSMGPAPATPPACDPYIPYTKPNISAPAVDVCSTVPGDGWDCGYTGTSMASPHTAGAVALLWSCNPSLIGQIDQTFNILQDNADTPPAGSCGAPPPPYGGNYSSGYGFLNVLQAGVLWCGPTGHLNGYVYDAVTTNPIVGATVDTGGPRATTDANGYYSMTLAVGSYTVTATHSLYTAQVVAGIGITTDTVTPQDFNLQPRGRLLGYVTDANSGVPLAATVTADDGTFADTDPATGYYEMYLDAGTYVVTATATDYAGDWATVVIAVGADTQQDFQLLAAIAVVPDPIHATLDLGQLGSVTGVMTNNMAVAYPFLFAEKGRQVGVQAGEDVLVVRHDATAATAMETALTNLGYTFLGVTDAEFQAMTVPELLSYRVVFHAGITGYAGTPSASEILLVAYLDAGGSLYISDNDLGYYRNGSTFYDTYLQATYDVDNAGDYLDGLDIMAGLTLDVSADPYPDGFTVGAEGTAIFQFQSSAEFGGVALDRNGYRAIYTDFDFQNIASAADETEVINRVMSYLAVFDVPWYGTSIVSGTVPAGGSLSWTNLFTATPAMGIDQPGEYYAALSIRPRNAPSLPDKEIPVILTVLPTADLGLLEGTVTSDRPGGPLEAGILIEASDGTTWTLTTDPATGYYSYWLEQGNYDVSASAAGYVPSTAAVVITGQQTTTQDFELALLAPEVVVGPLSLAKTLQLGQTGVSTLTISNDGLLPLDWEIRERSVSQALAGPEANPILLMGDDLAAADWDTYRTALTAAGVTWDEWDLLTQPFPTAVELAAYDTVIWADDNTIDPDNPECQIVADWLVLGDRSLFIAGRDFFWDWGTATPGTGEYNLYVLFNTTYLADYAGATIFTLDGVPGDPIGGDFAPPNSLTLAGTLDSNGDYADENSVATTGLLYGAGGAGSGHSALTHYEGANYKTVWLGLNFHDGLTAQGQRDQLMTNVIGFLVGADVPWLSEEPISGTVQPGESADVLVTFDSGAVSDPGVYRAELLVQSNDPLASRVDVPVTMTVLPGADIGRLQGTVTGMGYCDAESLPLEANVLIEDSSGMTWTTTTDPATGYYSRWLEAGTYTVTASAAGHLPAMGVIAVVGQETSTLDLALRYIESCMDVTPLAYSLTLPVDTVFTDALSIVNTGAGSLTWELHETTATQGLDVLVSVPPIAGRPNAASRAGARSYPARQFTVHLDRLSEQAISVLVITPDVVGGGDITLLLTTLAAFPDLNVTVWDASTTTPTVADMQGYDVVFVGNDILWTSSAIDKTVLSDNMADYLDAGGKILATSFIWSYDEWGFAGGRFLTGDYSPFEMATTDIWGAATLGTYDPNHPLMAGITSVTDNFNHQDVTLSPNGTWVASWNDGENFVAVAPNCVGLNQQYFYHADFGGETGVLLHNALLYLAGGGEQEWVDVPWVSEVPTHSVVLPDSAFDVDVIFDTSGLVEDECYTASLALLHDDPGWDTPVMIPLTLCVTSLVTPTASFESNSPVCLGQGMAFTDTSSGFPISWEWDFGDGITSTLQSPIHLYTAAGPYTVALLACNQAGCDTYTDTVEVLPLPLSLFTFDADQLTVTFTNASANATSYLWDFGDGITSTEASPVHVYAAADTYTVTLWATGGCGTDESSATVTVGYAPEASFGALSPVCLGTAMVFTNTTEGTAPIDYLWAFGDGITSTEVNPQHIYGAAGPYTVTLTASSEFGTSEASLPVEVLPLPVAAFTYTLNGLTVTFTNSSANATSYVWDFGDDSTSTETNPIHTYGLAATYTVTLQASGPCGTQAATMRIVVVVVPPPEYKVYLPLLFNGSTR